MKEKSLVIRLFSICFLLNLVYNTFTKAISRNCRHSKQTTGSFVERLNSTCLKEIIRGLPVLNQVIINALKA